MNRTLKTLRLKRSKKGMKGGTPEGTPGGASEGIVQLEPVTWMQDQDTAEPVYEYKCIYPGCNFYGNKGNHNGHVNECEYNSISLMNNFVSNVTLDGFKISGWKHATLSFHKYKTHEGDQTSLFMTYDGVHHNLLDDLISCVDPKRTGEKILRLNYSQATLFTKSSTDAPKLIIHFNDEEAKQKAKNWITRRDVWKSDDYTGLPNHVNNNSITDTQLNSKFMDAVGATLVKAEKAVLDATVKANAAVNEEKAVLAEPEKAEAASAATEKAEAVLIAAVAARDEATTNFATANGRLWMGPQDRSENVLTNPNSDIKLMWDINMKPIWVNIKNGIPLYRPTGVERLNIMGIQSPSDWETWEKNYTTVEQLKKLIKDTFTEFHSILASVETVDLAWEKKEQFDRKKPQFITRYDEIKKKFEAEKSELGQGQWSMIVYNTDNPDEWPKIKFKGNGGEPFTPGGAEIYPYMGIHEIPEGDNIFDWMSKECMTTAELLIKKKAEPDPMAGFVSFQ